MDLTRTRVVLRERAVVDILDLAVRFVAPHGLIYARTAIVVLAPLFLASVALAKAFGWVAAWSFAVFASTFAAAPFTVLASRLVFDDDLRVVSVVTAALGRVKSLLALRVAWVGAWTLVLPGLGTPVWFLVLAFFVVEVALLERSDAKGAIVRSVRLVQRESGEVILASILLALVHVVAVLSVDIGGRAVISALLESRSPDPVWAEGGSTLALLGFWLSVPYLATARFFVYLDVRTRSEGWDIQTRFATLAARPLADARRVA